MNDDDLRRDAATYITSGNGGREVHAAWRDGMLAQQRDVATARLQWDTLEERDRQLDQSIAQRVVDDLLEWIADQQAHER